MITEKFFQMTKNWKSSIYNLPDGAQARQRRGARKNFYKKIGYYMYAKSVLNMFGWLQRIIKIDRGQFINRFSTLP